MRFSGPFFRRAPLVGAAVQRLIVHSVSPGTEVPREKRGKVPHSMECGDLSPLFGEGFSLHDRGVDPDRNGVAPGWKRILQAMQ